MRGKFSRAIIGNSVVSLQILSDIKEKLQLGQNLSDDERGFLLWGLNRLTDGEHDPFTLELDSSQESLWPVTKQEKQFEFLREVEYQLKRAKKGGEDVGKDEAIRRAQPKLKTCGFNQGFESLRNLYYQLQRRWESAVQIFECMEQMGKTQPNEEIFSLVIKQQAAKNKTSTASELSRAWDDFGEFVLMVKPELFESD